MITSTSNPQVKNLQQLGRKAKLRNEQDVFLVEGTKMYLEAPAERIRKVYLSQSLYEEKGESFVKGHDVEILEDRVFAAACDTKTPQGVLCMVQQYHYRLEDLLKKKNPLLMILENLQDPGNLGTMVRTGAGAGITGIIMNKTTVDLFNPKTIRSTMGSIYRVPYLITEHLPDLLDELHKENIRLYAAHLKGDTYYDAFDFTGACGFLIGNEGNGLSDEIAECADCYLKIPMEGKVESLNAAVSAALLMYECKRQRGEHNENMV